MKAIHYIVIIVLLSLLGISLLALPIIVRALPGRYASLLPEPLQALRHTDHPLTLPTPVAAAEVEATVPPSATPLPSPTPTRLPTLTPEPSVTPSPTASPTAEPPTPTPTPTLPPAVLLEGLRHERQGWNNCGPTTLGMALSYWGRTERQAEIAPLLKPDPEDKHVGIQQMAEYAESLGLRAIVRSGGTLEELKQLLSAGFPVIVRTWYVRDARDQLGHYRLAIGYNDTTQRFDLYDSLYDPPTSMDYTELAGFVQRFESAARDVITAEGGRVVKTIGDAVLFVADDAVTGARIATGLARGTAVEGPVPVEVRVSVVWGRVLSRFGDVFGPPVNLAARLSAAAEPGTVLTDPVTAEMLSGEPGLAVLEQEPTELVGLGPVTPFRVERR